MGLADELLEDVKEAFDGELLDAVSQHTVTRKSGSYNTADGVNTVSIVATGSVRGVALTFTQREIAHSKGAIEEGDIRLLCIASELTVLSTIEIDDIITSGGQDYRVLTCPLDPTGTLYLLHLRLYNG